MSESFNSRCLWRLLRPTTLINKCYSLFCTLPGLSEKDACGAGGISLSWGSSVKWTPGPLQLDGPALQGSCTRGRGARALHGAVGGAHCIIGAPPTPLRRIRGSQQWPSRSRSSTLSFRRGRPTQIGSRAIPSPPDGHRSRRSLPRVTHLYLGIRPGITHKSREAPCPCDDGPAPCVGIGDFDKP